MGRGFLLIALFIAATALTYSSAFMAKSVSPAPHHASNITTHNPNTTTTTLAPNTTTHNPKTTTTTHAPNTTTLAPNTTTHNPKTTTTHAPKTTTTHAPNTTTHAPNTTTHAPNTTTHAPNTTTHAPNTTTQAPTPPPTPTPPTKLTVGNYNVTDGKGKICILAKLEIGIRVNTSTVNGTFIVQPNITTPSGICETKTARITLKFKEGSLTLQFNNSETAKKVYVDNVEYSLTYAFKKGEMITYSGKNKSIELFAAAQGDSYSCSAETVYMGNGVSLDLSNYRLQAFNIKNDQFGAREPEAEVLDVAPATAAAQSASDSGDAAAGTLLEVTFQRTPRQKYKYLQAEPKILGVTEIALTVFFIGSRILFYTGVSFERIANSIMLACFSCVGIIAGSVAIAAQKLHLPTNGFSHLSLLDQLLEVTQIALSATLAAYCCKVIPCCTPRSNVPVIIMTPPTAPQ
ncbi:Lysosome-associated membrane glycoprotein 1 [Anabarilius grahami]|uniref:Lysosome-associated membrane glycoprotein 1 n=1 Tax=Anabarilius grahami TaxID=495550 RepID=A0A3N0YH13_ANAGA|nr:Lysosome-associated membrane glycoprotein 1 [Anabarilius grahami]